MKTIWNFIWNYNTLDFISLVHLFNGELKGENLLLLLIGGSIAGIMYAVTAWTFNSIWASAILHMLWNINGLLNITTQDDHWGIYQYILDTKMY